MLKVFSMLLAAGLTVIVGSDSALAAGGCAPSAAVRTREAPTPATAARSGLQSTRRYSVAPGAYQAPAMRNFGSSYRSSYRAGGPSWSASRKVLGQ